PPLCPATCSIIVSKGITSVDRTKNLPKDTRIDFHSFSSVEVFGIEPFFLDSDNCGVRFEVTPGISPEDLKIKIFPSIGRFKIKVDNTRIGNKAFIRGKFETGRKYRFEVLGTELENRKIVKKGIFEFIAKGPEPSIDFETPMSLMELKGRQIIPVSLLNVPLVRCQMTRIPAYFAPEFSSLTLFAKDDRRQLRSGKKANASDDDSVNNELASAQERLSEATQRNNRLSEMAQYGDKIDSGMSWFLGDFTHNTETFFGENRKDKENHFSMPLGFRSLPERGGAFLVKVGDPEHSTINQVARLVQITDLSISYKLSERTLLIWVTSMATGKPVPDAA
ncbi:hypothetical protein HYY75_11845, partial [bacterium]|nr:hypothetical protein [bacterium]